MRVPIVSVTRLQLASRWHFPQFLFHSLRSIAQVRRSRGYMGGWTSNDAENGFWTATVWESLDAMRAFRNSGAHLKAMPKLLHMCNQAAYTHFEQMGTDVPTTDAAYDRLSRGGNMSKVNAPSARHLAGERVGRSKPRQAQRWAPKPPA
jgi:heme-degrading monooxygenase HmoA